MKYSVILADPPWPYRVWNKKKNAKTAEHHYPGMSIAQICAVQVSTLAAPNCALFLWAVWPSILEYVPRVLSAWGFTYKTCAFVWLKTVKDGYIEYDVTAHSPAHIVNSIREHVVFNKMNRPPSEKGSTKWVVCLDEIARVPNKVQENLIKVVENSRRAIFVLCFSDPSAIITPIRERGVLIPLPLPTSQHASDALMRIANAEGYGLDESVARHIVESVRRVPRRCVLALEQAAIMSPSKVIELEAADAAAALVAS